MHRQSVPADTDHGIIHGGNIAGNDGLQCSDNLSRSNDGINRLLGDGAMPAAPFELNCKNGRTSHDRARRNTQPPYGTVIPQMHCQGVDGLV